MAGVRQQRQRAREQPKAGLQRDVGEIQPDPERERTVVADGGMIVVRVTVGHVGIFVPSRGCP